MVLMVAISLRNLAGRWPIRQVVEPNVTKPRPNCWRRFTNKKHGAGDCEGLTCRSLGVPGQLIWLLTSDPSSGSKALEWPPDPRVIGKK
jgi:hypothetical protein